MEELFDYLREFNFTSVTVRLVLALILGGSIGLERVKKGRPAGFRTHMLVCMGATLTMILSQYDYTMLTTVWAEYNAIEDVSRYGAQVINGIGFLGAGTILITYRRQQVKGLTTAAGLWASATMGLALGVGFYEAVLMAFVLIIITIRVLPALEAVLVQCSRNMLVYVEVKSIENINEILYNVKLLNIQIFEVDIDHEADTFMKNPSAILALHLPRKLKHETIISSLSDVKGIRLIKEL